MRVKTQTCSQWNRKRFGSDTGFVVGRTDWLSQKHSKVDKARPPHREAVKRYGSAVGSCGSWSLAGEQGILSCSGTGKVISLGLGMEESNV